MLKHGLRHMDDNIGNRQDSTEGTASPAYYCGNEVNQYTATSNPSESFTHDDDGNLTADGTFDYTWDAENRLVKIQTHVPFAADPSEGDNLVEFKYDYMNRRVEKRYRVYVGETWTDQSDGWQRFVYDQWNVILVLDASDSNATLKKYTWGLDLSGLSGNASVSGIHNAGGIGGGLLAVEETAETGTPSYWFFYDANGNVGQIVNNTANYTVAAHHEYDPYGNVITAVDSDSSSYVNKNPIRFSTKWFDAETGLGYWGYRYYSPRLGRWSNRDPIEEDGGLNLYAFVHSSPVNHVDVLGKILGLFPRPCDPATTTWCQGLCTRKGQRYKACIITGVWRFIRIQCLCSQRCFVVGHNTGIVDKKTCLPLWECTANCPNGYSWTWKQPGRCPTWAWS